MTPEQPAPPDQTPIKPPALSNTIVAAVAISVFVLVCATAAAVVADMYGAVSPILSRLAMSCLVTVVVLWVLAMLRREARHATAASVTAVREVQGQLAETHALVLAIRDEMHQHHSGHDKGLIAVEQGQGRLAAQMEQVAYVVGELIDVVGSSDEKGRLRALLGEPGGTNGRSVNGLRAVPIQSSSSS